MAKHTIYCTRQTRHEGARVKVGDKITVDSREMPVLMSSGRFSETEPEKPAKAEKPAKDSPKDSPAP